MPFDVYRTFKVISVGHKARMASVRDQPHLAGEVLGLDQAQGLGPGEGEGRRPGDGPGAGQAIAASGIARLSEGEQLDALGRDVGAAATAAGPGLGGDDDVDAASLRIAAAGRQGLGPADRDLDRLAAGAEPRASAGGGRARRP